MTDTDHVDIVTLSGGRPYVLRARVDGIESSRYGVQATRAIFQLIDDFYDARDARDGCDMSGASASHHPYRYRPGKPIDEEAWLRRGRIEDVNGGFVAHGYLFDSLM